MTCKNQQKTHKKTITTQEHNAKHSPCTDEAVQLISSCNRNRSNHIAGLIIFLNTQTDSIDMVFTPCFVFFIT